MRWDKEYFLNYFSPCCPKTPWPKQGKGGKAYCCSLFTGAVLHGGYTIAVGTKAAGYISSTIKKQSDMNAYFFLFLQFRILSQGMVTSIGGRSSHLN